MLFQAPILGTAEQAVLDRIEDLRRRLGASLREPRRWDGLLRRTALARAIRGSNTIEGYNVTIDDAVAAVEGEAPLDADGRTWKEITGYRSAMTYVLQLARDEQFAYSTDILRSLHFMMLQHDLSKGPGQWRPGYIAVRSEASGETVYEGPDAEEVPALMAELIASLNEKQDASPVVRAAMAHLNLVMIHPYRDGNGRMARCLQTLVLGRGGQHLNPVFSSIEEYLGRNQQAYYDVLAQVGQGRWNPEGDTLPWIRFCMTAHYRQATTTLNRIERMRRIWEDLDKLVRDRGLPERAIFALADATMGHMVRNSTYRAAADVSDNVASRDLKRLVDSGLLEPSGEKRGRTYRASSELEVIRQRNTGPRDQVEDPFAPVKGDR